MIKRPVIAIIGPTSSGKTLLAHQISEHRRHQGQNTAIINLDTRQMIKRFSIGTGKPSPTEQSCYNYHFIDIYENNDIMNSKQISNLLTDTLNSLPSHQLPILVVGSPFYFYFFLHKRPNLRQELTNAFRQTLQHLTQTHPELCWKWFQNQHLERTIAPSDHYRMTRALELWFEDDLIDPTPQPSITDQWSFLTISPNIERSTLLIQIQTRVQLFFKEGWEQEVKTLSENSDPYLPQGLGWRSIGYREILDNQQSLCSTKNQTQLIADITAKTWQYAKKQLNWIQKINKKFPIHPVSTLDQALSIIATFLKHH